MIERLDLGRLRAIGLTPIIVGRLADMAPSGATTELMRVTEVQREGLTLHDGVDEHDARAHPSLLRALDDDGDALAVGDWVLAERDPWHQWWIHRRVPPANQLARRLHDGRDKVTRVVIVANVDTALLVMGLDHDFNLRRLERYVALVRMAGIGAVIVLTKADLCSDAEARVRSVQDLVPADIGVVSLDATGDQPRERLRPWLEGGTLVLLGSSGVGKSTLTNALAGHDLQAVGAARAGDGRGRHTTTVRSLHVTAAGACIIDTPGLRTLRLDGDAAHIGASFDDIARLAPQCRFRDCRHDDEPGCAVRGQVPESRLRSYRKLLREAQRDQITALQRKERLSVWKQRSRAARAVAKAKRG